MYLMSTMTMSATSSCSESEVKMTVMDLKLVLCFLLGLFSVSSAQRQYQVRLIDKGSTNYPHAGRPEVYINGAWATICASDWDMNDAEVVCRDLGLGYPNSLTVSGGLPAESTGVNSVCLSTVKCYGHEEHLSECVTLPETRSGDTNDKGIVCFPPPSDPGLQLTYGPDQYSGYVEVELASGRWSGLYVYYPDYWTYPSDGYIPNICRQLGYGELNWWDVVDWGSTVSLTAVHSCAYGVAHHASCTFRTFTTKYQAFVGCHKPGSIPCSAPYVPPYSTVQDLRLNYNFTDKVIVTCDASDSSFTLQCHNKGLWSGPVVSCPPPALLEPPAAGLVAKAQCSAPAVPLDSNIQNLRLSYKHKDKINVTCNEVTNGVPEWFELTCANGIWNGQNIVCPDPVKECNQPILSIDSSVKTIRARYKIGESVNIKCKSAFVSFVWTCNKDGLWRGPVVSCPVSQPPHSGDAEGRIGYKEPEDKQDGRNVFITGLLVAAVIMFVLVLMSLVAFSISVKGRSFGPSKHSLQDEKTDRGPLPDVPAGYADYLVGDKSVYTAPYLKPDEIHHSYETYEKPI